MVYNKIEVQILHVNALHENNDFGVRVLLDDKDISVLELDKSTMLHIGVILINASKHFIKNADKQLNNK